MSGLGTTPALFAGEIPFLQKKQFREFLPPQRGGIGKEVKTTWDVLVLLFQGWNDSSQRALRKMNGDYSVQIKIWKGGLGGCKLVEDHLIPVSDMALITDLLVRGYVEGTRSRGCDYSELRISEQGIGALMAHLRSSPQT